jgi:AhpC/TSA family
VTVLAISMDSPDDSRAFARDYGIAFPLLADADGTVSRTYAGVTSDANTLPGVTIVRGDGRIVFRQVASAKDDRMSSAELIATIDRTLGTSGPAAVQDGFAVLDRAQVRIDFGAGITRSGDDTAATASGAGSLLLPLGRHVLVGPRARWDSHVGALALDGIALLRAPILGGAGAFELGMSGGWTPYPALHTGPNIGGTADVWFAISPRLSVQAGVTTTRYEHTGGAVTDVSVTLGIGGLFQIRRH